jgi:neutral ceramidase
VAELQAGVARTLVTPPLGTYLIGYADRHWGCRSVHDDLTATALVVDDGDTQLVLIALDMLVLNERVVARVRGGVAAEWRIPRKQVMICCSHTHSGPIAYADENGKRKNRRFIDGLVDKLVKVVGGALGERVPVSAAWGKGEVHIAINRRERLPSGEVIIGVNPAGPVDRSLLVLQLRHQLSGRPVATLVNLACHATVLGPRSYAVSAEWPGVMRREVEARVGGSCLFIQGATGDLNPNHEWGRDDLAVMEAFGCQVAHGVLGVARHLEPLSLRPLQGRAETVWLPIVPERRPDGRPTSYQEALTRKTKLPRFLVDPLLNARYPWQTTLEWRQDGGWGVAMEIQGFRLGDCAVVAHAAETFNEVGATIKASSPAPITLFAGYSNGCIGYLPTAAAHALGGYEVEMSPYLYRMPGLLDPDCDMLVRGQSQEMLQALWEGG